MKKILLAFMIIGAALFSITCDRNDLYDNNTNSAPSLIGLNLDTNGSTGPTAIYLYRAYVPLPLTYTFQGNLGGRIGADNLCNSIASPPSTTVVHAFLSVTVFDNIQDLVPPAYWGLPVVDAGGANIISSTWANLWDGSIDMTLSNAGVLGGGLEWWNGSNLDGTYRNTNTCSDWTSNNPGFSGIAGNSNFPALPPLPPNDALWLNFATYPCDTFNYLLCVAY